MTKKQSKTTNKDVKYIPDTAHIIKLNEELTEENSKLLERVDELTNKLCDAIEIKNNLQDVVDHLNDEIKGWKSFYSELEDKLDESTIEFHAMQSEKVFAVHELNTIKSKWWYKLFINW